MKNKKRVYCITCPDSKLVDEDTPTYNGLWFCQNCGKQLVEAFDNYTYFGKSIWAYKIPKEKEEL